MQALTRVAAARLASGCVPQAGAHHAWQPRQSRVKRYPPTHPYILGAACAIWRKQIWRKQIAQAAPRMCIPGHLSHLAQVSQGGWWAGSASPGSGGAAKRDVPQPLAQSWPALLLLP